ncbi:predicted protein [Lichtheimia corymbifera JMRC:FSU:9682]|uniref:Uncharacterized protein n=1 Tax=Lichtheimia corymbifera JMRC:FSU:9682 TaxID=1263082 RepID=A0A068SHR9_9FUNG|nr:predicted protein [Lichtheimia corymbifera JMRC:FSU:9682]
MVRTSMLQGFRLPMSDANAKASKQCLRKHVPREVFTANQHYLYHIQWIIERLGPLRSTSCKVMERIIGMVKSAMKAPGQPVRVNLFTAPLQLLPELKAIQWLPLRYWMGYFGRRSKNTPSFKPQISRFPFHTSVQDAILANVATAFKSSFGMVPEATERTYIQETADTSRSFVLDIIHICSYQTRDEVYTLHTASIYRFSIGHRIANCLQGVLTTYKTPPKMITETARARMSKKGVELQQNVPAICGVKNVHTTSPLLYHPYNPPCL